MSSSSSSPREVIQLSLGPKANAITAHLLNLQGLAATNNNNGYNGHHGTNKNEQEESSYSYCDPLTTHYVQNSTWVPRVLMIDEGKVTVPLEQETAASVTPAIAFGACPSSSSSALFEATTTSSFLPWQGDVQVLGNVNDTTSKNGPFWQTASAIAYSPYSRYHATITDERQQHNAASSYQSSAENPRHVVWDDDDNEEDEEAARRTQEAQDYAHQQQKRARQEWNTTTSVALGQELKQQAMEQFGSITKSTVSPSSSSSSVHWTDIWMPPYSLKDSKVVLPFSSLSQLVPHWDVAYSTASSRNELPFLREWKEDVLLEKLRHLLESCDYGIQGSIITTEGTGMYASLSTMLLEELQQECKSAARWVNHVDTDSSGQESPAGSAAAENPQDLSWQERQVARVRTNISKGLALYDFNEKANVVLPLRMDFSAAGEFTTGAYIAMGLEACGLPFRLRERQNNSRGSLPYQMGLQNAPFLAQGGGDTEWGSTAFRLSMTEYLTMLQPSSRYSMLELNIMLPQEGSLGNQGLYEKIRAGTSVERDQRMRERGEDGYRNRPRDVLPGDWLGDLGGESSKCGLMTSLSHKAPVNSKQSFDRTAHHHFALSTAVRSTLVAPTRDKDGITMQNYLTSLVQGMGIQYRPERSMAMVMDEPMGRLTFGSDEGENVYGAGVYWKNILPRVDTPLVAVLSNSTRAYWSLNEVATNMKATIRGSKFRGYVSRDVLNGVLPELDDCEESMEGCFDRRDTYYPPEGSGMDSEDDFE